MSAAARLSESSSGAVATRPTSRAPARRRPSWRVHTGSPPRSPRAAGRSVVTSGSPWPATARSLINTLTAVQDTALAEAARRESDWCEDGTLGEVAAPRPVGSCSTPPTSPHPCSVRRTRRRSVGSSWRCAWPSLANPCPPTAAPLPTPTGSVGCTPRWPRVGSTGTARASSPTSSRSRRPRSRDAVVAALDDHLHDDAPTLRRRTRRLVAAHLARPAARARPAGAHLDRVAPLGLGAGRRHLGGHVPQRGCRGGLGRDRPARARPGRRRHLLDRRAGPRQGTHRPRHQQRDDRRADRARRAGRQGRDGARESGFTAADHRDASAEPLQGRPVPVAGESTGTPDDRTEPTAVPGSTATTWCRCREPDRRSRCWCVATGSSTTSRTSHGSAKATREGTIAVRAVRPGHGRPPRPRRPALDRHLPTGHRARGAGPRPRRPVPLPRLQRGSPLLRPRPRAALADRTHHGRQPGHAVPTSPPRQAATGLAGAPVHPTAPRPGPTRRGRDRTTAPLDALETVLLRSDPVDDVGADADAGLDLGIPPHRRRRERQARGALSRPCSRSGWSTTRAW